MINENGFIQVPKKIYFSPDFSNEAKTVYTVLKGHCFEKETCFPGLGTISKEASMSTYKCLKGMKELVAKGLVSKRRRGLGLTNTYILNDF